MRADRIRPQSKKQERLRIERRSTPGVCREAGTLRGAEPPGPKSSRCAFVITRRLDELHNSARAGVASGSRLLQIVQCEHVVRDSGECRVHRE
jgi:hypothetical protein